MKHVYDPHGSVRENNAINNSNFNITVTFDMYEPGYAQFNIFGNIY